MRPIFNIFKYVNSIAIVLLQWLLSPVLNQMREVREKKKKKKKKWKNATQDSAENAESKRALYLQ